MQIRNFILSATGEVVSKGALFVAQILLARRMQVHEFGEFSLVFALIGFGWMMTNFGSGLYGTREIARNITNTVIQQSVISKIIALRVVIVSAYTFVVLTLSGLQLLGLQLSGFLILMLLGLVFRCFSLDWFNKGVRRFEVNAFVLSSGYMVMLGSIYFGYTQSSNMSFVGLVWAGAYLLIAGIYQFDVYVIRGLTLRVFRAFTVKGIADIAKKARFFWISGVANNLYQVLPFILISQYYTTHEVGLFSAVFQVGLGFVFVISLIPSFFYTLLSSLSGENDRDEFVAKMKLLLVSVLAVSTLTAALIAIYPESLLNNIVGNAYSDGKTALSIMAFFVLFRTLREVLYMVLSSLDRQKSYTKISMLAPVLWLVMFGVLVVILNDVVVSAVLSLVLSEMIVISMLALIRRNVFVSLLL